MSDDIRDMIKSAIDKNAAEFENQFSNVMSAKMDAALTQQYDAMFGKPEEAQVEVEDEIDATPEVEDLETEE